MAKPLFSIASNLFASHPVEVALPHIAKAGAGYVDLWSCPPICNHVDPLRHPASYVRRLLAESGLTLGPASVYLTTPEERRRAIEYAAELGADSVILEPGPLADFHRQMVGLDLQGRTLGEPGDSWERSVEILADYLRLCGELGLKLALEVPHVFTQVERPEAIHRLNRELGSFPALAYCLAPTHALARGATIKETIEACGERLWVFYLWDVKPGYDPARDGRRFGDGEQQLPGLGSLDWTVIRGYLDGVGFAGYCDMKCHSTEKWTDLDRLDDAIGRSAARVRALMDL